MKIRPVLAAALTAVAATAAIVGTAGSSIAEPASVPPVVADGGFEANTSVVPTADSGGQIATNPNWQSTDSFYGTGLCVNDDYWCWNDPGYLGPRTGNGWVQFGYNPAGGHTGVVHQWVTVPEGATTLTFWYRNGAVSAPFDATLSVVINGLPVKVINEASAPQSEYSQVSVDITDFASGAPQDVHFNYDGGSASADGNSVNNMEIDDVAIS
jgi:hypothetical protein